MSIYKDGMIGLIVGDALGGPVQFMTREELKDAPVTEMEPFRYEGGFPAGTWSDDSSMALAILKSIKDKKEIDLPDIMNNFVKWYDQGEFTPFGQAFDEGSTTSDAIESFMESGDVTTCGQKDEWSNGNGSIMRTLPACVFVYEKEKQGKYSSSEAMHKIHSVSALTHANRISKIGCGIYYKLVKSILEHKNDMSLMECLQRGVEEAATYYDRRDGYRKAFYPYVRLMDLDEFSKLAENEIKSGGYIVETLEAAVWGLLTTNSFEECLLKVVNLGEDTDTVGAVAGGLAGIYYGYEGIPEEWVLSIQGKFVIWRVLQEEKQ